MKIKDLKKLLSEVPDGMTLREWNEVDVLIPMSGEFDGYFKHPCMEETGLAHLGMDEGGDNNEPAFCIVPCGFFQEHEGVPPELN